MYKTIRVRFCKQGEAVYFSHLDLNRTVMRLLRKSGVDFWYTEGFNPHPHVVFASPLSLGMESETEIFEFKISEDYGIADIKSIKAVFPEVLKVLDVYESARKFKEIAYASYQITLSGEQNVLPCFDQPMMVVKKSKRSEKEVDVRDYVSNVSAEHCDGNTILRLNICSSSDKNLNPNYVLTALKAKNINCDGAVIRRMAFLDNDYKIFQ